MDKLQQYFIKIRNLLDMTIFRVIFFLIIGIILFGAMFSNVKPEKLNIKLFSIAHQTIRSPGTVEDKQSTEEKRKEARDQVQDVYTLKKEYTQNRVDLITSIFQAAAEVNDDVNKDLKKDTASSQEKVATAVPSVAERIAKLKGKLTTTVTKDLSDQVFTALVQASNSELSIAKDLTVTAINHVMSQKISADDVENAKKRVEEELKYSTLNDPLKQAAIELGRYAIIQNEFYDPQATEELRRQAAEAVEPVKILQGQVIVEEGELINREIYQQLKLVGLLNTEKSYKPFIGLVVLILIIVSAIYYYFYQMKAIPEKRQTYLLLYGMIFIFSILLMKIISLLQIFNFSGIGYLFPAAMAGILIKIMIDERLAILTSIILAICGSILLMKVLRVH